VAPAKLENVYQLSNLIAQCFVYGNSYKSITVMVAIIDENAFGWARQNGKEENLAALAKDPDMKKAIQAEIQKFSKENGFNSVETPRDVFVSDQQFSVENDCMTPTFKMKRAGIQAFFQADIDVMYEKIDKILAERDAKAM